MKIIEHKILAGFSGLLLKSHEEQRVELMLQGVAKKIGYGLHAWSVNTGRVCAVSGQAFGEQEPNEVLDSVASLDEKTILVLRDFHLILKAEDPVTLRKLKDSLIHAKSTMKCIIILAPDMTLPLDLEKLFSLVEFALPDRDELKVILQELCDGTKDRAHPIPMPKGIELDSLLDAASGLTTIEAEDAFALSIIEADKLCPKIVSREKSGCVKKSGLMEIVETKVTFDSIGGCEILKDELRMSKHRLTKAAYEYGLTCPRPKLLLGNPGTGKTLTAEAMANEYELLGLRLDSSKLMDKFVGSSESLTRQFFDMVKALGRVHVHVDEADGLFAAKGGELDGGARKGVEKIFLQKIQELAPLGAVFTFTANDIDAFPDAFIDRCSIWNIELPTHKERISIWTIHIKQKGRDPKKFDCEKFAALTDGFSGRQIKDALEDAMTLAYSENPSKPREFKTADIEAIVSKMTATSITMAKTIEARRQRLVGKAKNAGLPDNTKVQTTGRKIAA